MLRRFNSSGPCNPDQHYTVMRDALVARGQKLVDQGRYFTIFAPRSDHCFSAPYQRRGKTLCRSSRHISGLFSV